MLRIQQFCWRCEGIEDYERECERCGVRKHAFWEDPVGDLAYLRTDTLGQEGNGDCP